jgi:hypothetical protein
VNDLGILSLRLLSQFRAAPGWGHEMIVFSHGYHTLNRVDQLSQSGLITVDVQFAAVF